MSPVLKSHSHFIFFRLDNVPYLALAKLTVELQLVINSKHLSGQLLAFLFYLKEKTMTYQKSGPIKLQHENYGKGREYFGVLKA